MKNTAVYTKKNKIDLDVRAAIYCRLSKDDNLDGESESIQNQKLLLTDYCRGHGWQISGIYEDDGISGLKMETRPGLQRMLNDVRMGKIDLVITKDTSRLARNYLDFGHLFEEFFPSGLCAKSSTTPQMERVQTTYAEDRKKNKFPARHGGTERNGCVGTILYQLHKTRHHLTGVI